MENKKTYTTLYTVLLVALTVVFAVIERYLAPALGILLGAVILAPLALAVFHDKSLPPALMFGAALSALTLVFAPSPGTALTSIALWFGGAMIIGIFVRRTPDLFPLLMYGGFAFILLVVIGLSAVIKQHYGVFDFFGVFRNIQDVIVTTINEALSLYSEIFKESEMDLIAPAFEILIEGAEALTYQILWLGITLLGGLYLWTIKIGKTLSRHTEHKVVTMPLMLYGVPREITACYMIITVVSLFVPDDYIYAFNFFNSAMSYLYVLAGIGFFDALAQGKWKWSLSGRTAFKCLLLGIAFLSDCFGSGILFTILTIVGIYISISRVIVFKNIGGKDK